MKYMANGGFRAHPLIRLTLGCTLALLVCLWISSTLLYFDRMDLTSDSVVRYYRGSEADFSAPRTYGSMLERSHVHFAMMSMVLLLLTHLAIFLPWPLRVRVALVVGTFLGALLQETGGWLVRFVDPGFAVLGIAGFLGLQAGLLVLIAGVGGSILRPGAIEPPRPACE